MNSTLKTALPIGLVVLMVFGITFMSQFTAPAPPAVDRDEEQLALPLIVGNAEVKHDPVPTAPAHDRFFTGNFEVGTDETRNRVGFVVRNARPTNVFLTALPPSCAACTSARGAAIPAPVLRNYFQHVAAGSLWSPYPTFDLVSAVAWAQARPKLAWHEFVFDDKSSKFELPGATAADGEAWGLIELGFKMSTATAPSPKHAAFDVLDSAGNKLSPPYPFTVVVGGREAQEIHYPEFEVPELSDTSTAHNFEFICISATRTELPPPTVSVEGNDPHIALAKPIPLNARELDLVSRVASAKPQSGGGLVPIQYLSGYRIPGSIQKDAGGRSIDLGPYEKNLFIGAGPGIVLQKPTRVKLHGSVVGAIRLEGINKIDFGSYDGNFVQKKDARLWTERKGLELEIVPELCSPNFLKVALAKPTFEADRTYWSLAVSIPAKEGRSPPWDGFIYLRSKGEKPLNIRIQVSGHGR